MVSSQKEQVAVTEIMVKENLDKKSPSFWTSKRYFIALLMFWGYYNMFSLRLNISIAIVQMTSSVTTTVGNQTIISGPEFKWDSITKGLVLSASLYGYMFSMFTGPLVKRIGGCTSYGIGQLGPAILSVFSPFLLRTHFYLFLLGRFLEGVFEVIGYCSCTEIWAKWAAPKERARLISCAVSGVYLGMVVAFPFYGFIAHHWGWPSIFYTTGAITFIWFVIWASTVSNDPATDKWISKKERLYLEHELKETNIKSDWSKKRILTSSAFWAFFLAKMMYSIGLFLFTNCMPLYIKAKSDLGIQYIGFLSAAPNLFGLVCTPLFGLLSDCLRNRQILSVTNIHKLFIGGGFIMCSLSIFAAALSSDFNVSFTLIILFKLLLVASHQGLITLPIFLSPRFPGIIFGYITAGYTIGSFFCSMAYGFIVRNNTEFEWNLFFVVVGILSLIFAIVFLIYGSADVQPWDSNHKSSKNTVLYAQVNKG